MLRKPAFGHITKALAALWIFAILMLGTHEAIAKISSRMLFGEQSTQRGSDLAPTILSQQNKPLADKDQRAIDERLIFNRALVDAAVLLTDLDNYRRGKSKKSVSLSAFRSLEIRLSEIANRDSANLQARDMANAMKLAQFQLLQPSVVAAAEADRQLFAAAMSQKLQSQGVAVSAAGAGSNIVQLTSPTMTREMGRGVADSEKIPEQARRLEFKTIVFSNGKRKWRYVLSRANRSAARQ